MKISKKWLQDFVFLPDSLSPAELAKDLTLHTVEVEGIEDLTSELEGVVLGVIKEVEKHSNADSLNVCKVDVGDEVLQIVCGGSNVKTGMRVAVAKVGAKVRWHGQGELIVLGEATIRGVQSFGMICASEEIGLGEEFPKKEEKEILDLTSYKQKAGTPLSKVLGKDDVVFEIDNKSMTHRSDLWGHYGIAREISVLHRKKLTPYNPPLIKEGEEMHLSVDVQTMEACPRYMAVMIDSVDVVPSPQWLKERLLKVGVRPINLVVDITNYVMMDLGQPMHAFDAAKLTHGHPLSEKKSKFDAKKSRSLVVRFAKEGEKLLALDNKEYTLTPEMLVIADGEKPLALAGVIGGEESGVTEKTQTVIFESANFHATTIRKTALKLGIRTDASTRFEKSLDPMATEFALRKAVTLLLELCPNAKVVSSVVDKKHFSLFQGPLEVSFAYLASRIGADIDKKRVVDILERLGFTVKKEKNGVLHITIPSFRATKDIARAEDIVEEVIRIYGYKNIVGSVPSFPLLPPYENRLKKLEKQVKNILALEEGFFESYNYSFESPDILKKMGVDTSLHIELLNPIAKDRPYVRRSLLPNLLQNAEMNLNRFESVKLFEVGRVYKIEEGGERVELKSDNLLPNQDLMLGLVYVSKNNSVPFFELSGALQDLMSRLHSPSAIVPLLEVPTYFHPGRAAEIRVGDIVLGTVAEIHPTTAKNLKFEHRVAVAEINLNLLLRNLTEKIVYQSVPTYPSVIRDIAFIVDRSTSHAALSSTLKNISPLIREVKLFDVYEGEKMEKTKKSMAYHIEYRSDEKTLTTEEVDTLHLQVVSLLEKEFKAEMRK